MISALSQATLGALGRPVAARGRGALLRAALRLTARPSGSGAGSTRTSRATRPHAGRPGRPLVRVAADGRVDRLRIRSASFVNWPLVPLPVPGNVVPNFPLINRSFELCYACCEP